MPKITETALMSSVIPELVTTGITLETGSEKDRASINMVIQDVLYNNSKLPNMMAHIANSNWWFDPKSYFNLSIIAISGEPGDLPAILQVVQSDEFIKKYIKWGIHDAWWETYGESLPSGITAKTISLKETSDDITDEDEFKIFKKYKTHDPQTNMEILNIPYRTELSFEGDLHLVSFIHINPDTIGENIETSNVSLPDSLLVHSTPDINNVVVNGQANNTKAVFFRADRQDEIWNGPYEINVNGTFFSSQLVTDALAGYEYAVNTIEQEASVKRANITKNIGGYRTTAIQPTNQYIPLNKTTITNNIVSDMRAVQRVEPVSLDFKSLENDVYSFIKYNVPKDNVKLQNNISSYVSPLMMTTDRTGVNKLMFSINFRKLIRDNTPLAIFLDAGSDAGVQKNILKDCQIYSLRVVRRLVKKGLIDNRSAAVGSVQSNYQSPNKYQIEDNSTPELIVSSKDLIAPTFRLMSKEYTKQIPQTITTQVGSQQTTTMVEVKVGEIEEINNVSFLSEQNLLGVRHFYVTDTSAAEILGGEYQYSIELVVKNGAKEYVKNRIQGLKNKTLDLRKYYNLAVGSSVSAGKTTTHYNTLYQKFTKIFQNKAYEKPNPTALGTRWALAYNAISEFVEMMKLFYENASKESSVELPGTQQLKSIPESNLPKEFTEEAKVALLNNLISLTEPGSGSPRGIESTLSMISTFTDTMSKLMGENISSNKQGSTGASQNIGSSKTNTSKMIIFNHDFNDLYKPTPRKFMGYDCLNSSIASLQFPLTADNTSIKSMALDEYHVRTQEESSKYFVPGALGYTDVTDGEDPLYGQSIYSFDFRHKNKSNGSIGGKITNGESPENSAYSFLTPSYIHTSRNPEESLQNIAAIDSQQPVYEINDLKLQDYVRALLKVLMSNELKTLTGTPEFSSDKLVGSGNPPVIPPPGDPTIGNPVDANPEFIKNTKIIRDMLSFDNCTVHEFIHRPIKNKKHNQQIRFSKDAVTYKEKTFSIESGGGDKDIIKIIPEGPEYDENGNFTNLRLPREIDNRLARHAIEVMVLKNKLPTKHPLLGNHYGQFRERVRDYDYKQDNTLLHHIFYNYYFTEESLANDLSGLPNQLKSMIHAAVGDVVDVAKQPAVSPWNFSLNDETVSQLAMFAYMFFNYKSIFKVEALVGYENNGDVNSPIWQTLTPELLEQMRDANSNSARVLCKLVGYNDLIFNVFTGLGENNSLFVPLHDEYFLIQNTDTSQTQQAQGGSY